MVKQAVSLQPMADDGEQKFHLQPVEDPALEQVEAPEEGCDPMGSPCWSKLLAGPVDPWRQEPTPEQCHKNLMTKKAAGADRSTDVCSSICVYLLSLLDMSPET
ncbi:AN1-type zinc finger protein 5-like [Grus japonensis]|uniref:AN1-type zinc finger protein 5-like n=1 Tax=Grus japonensis TaxID=30415 RepID=A0ABC9WXB8_GRUJA